MRVSEMRKFADSEGVAAGLAADVENALQEALKARGRATLAVSGGATPALFFAKLAQAEIGWGKVTVTLVDERYVPPDSERSNEKLVRERLLTGPAAQAQFVPLYSDANGVEAAAQRASVAVSAFLPADVLVLGMGTDGHTASLFPDAEGAEELLKPPSLSRASPAVLPVRAPSAEEPRLTLSLEAIATARALFLHIEGTEKRAVLENAAERNLPIAAVIKAARAPVVTYWAP